MNFKTRIFIVSGTNSGIGKACAELLLDNEAMVVGLDIKKASITHERYIHYLLDVTDEEQVITVLNEIEIPTTIKSIPVHRINDSLKLDKNIELEGDLILTAGILDLNGHELIVISEDIDIKGDLHLVRSIDLKRRII